MSLLFGELKMYPFVCYGCLFFPSLWRYYQYSCCEHLCTHLSVDMCFYFSWVDTKKWDGRAIW